MSKYKIGDLVYYICDQKVGEVVNVSGDDKNYLLVAFEPGSKGIQPCTLVFEDNVRPLQEGDELPKWIGTGIAFKLGDSVTSEKPLIYSIDKKDMAFAKPMDECKNGWSNYDKKYTGDEYKSGDLVYVLPVEVVAKIIAFPNTAMVLLEFDAPDKDGADKQYRGFYSIKDIRPVKAGDKIPEAFVVNDNKVDDKTDSQPVPEPSEDIIENNSPVNAIPENSKERVERFAKMMGYELKPEERIENIRIYPNNSTVIHEGEYYVVKCFNEHTHKYTIFGMNGNIKDVTYDQIETAPKEPGSYHYANGEFVRIVADDADGSVDERNIKIDENVSVGNSFDTSAIFDSDDIQVGIASDEYITKRRLTGLKHSIGKDCYSPLFGKGTIQSVVENGPYFDVYVQGADGTKYRFDRELHMIFQMVGSVGSSRSSKQMLFETPTGGDFTEVFKRAQFMGEFYYLNEFKHICMTQDDYGDGCNRLAEIGNYFINWSDVKKVSESNIYGLYD